MKQISTQRWLTSVIAVAAILILSTTAWSLTVALVGLPSMAADASVIIEGRVLDSHVEAIPGKVALVTDYRIQITRRYKTPRGMGDFLTVRIPGGELKGQRVEIPGMPGLKTGQEILLFAETVPHGQDGQARYLPYGLSQGIFSFDSSKQAFLRENPDFAMVSLQPWCTGGERQTSFSAESMRGWLRDVFKLLEVQP